MGKITAPRRPIEIINATDNKITQLSAQKDDYFMCRVTSCVILIEIKIIKVHTFQFSPLKISNHGPVVFGISGSII